MPVAPKDAATVVLMRDRVPDGGEPEVLLVRRHPQANFAAGAHVFPGGMLEEGDYGEAARRLSPGLLACAAQSVIADIEPREKALGIFIAAIRETFEEVGVLLARDKNGSRWRTGERDGSALAEAREDMYRGSVDFISWVSGMQLTLATQDLVYFAHWITPDTRPKRFDTRFFLARVDRFVDVQTDRREVFDRLWVTPAEAVRRHEKGKLNLMTPTVKNLELLGNFSSTEEAIKTLKEAPVQTILPKIRFTPDGERKVLHPGDKDYDLY